MLYTMIKKQHDETRQEGVGSFSLRVRFYIGILLNFLCLECSGPNRGPLLGSHSLCVCYFMTAIPLSGPPACMPAIFQKFSRCTGRGPTRPICLYYQQAHRLLIKTIQYVSFKYNMWYMKNVQNTYRSENPNSFC